MTSGKEHALGKLPPTHFGFIEGRGVGKYGALAAQDNTHEQHSPVFNTVITRQHNEIAWMTENVPCRGENPLVPNYVVLRTAKQQPIGICMIRKVDAAERDALALRFRNLND